MCSTWVVLTCGCRDGTEVNVLERGRTGAAVTGIRGAQMGIILETWRRRWRRVEPRAWSRGANMTITGAAGAAGTADGGDVSGLGRSVALLALPCVGGGTERSKGSLEYMHPMKNSVSGSWVVASAEATLCEGVLRSCV